MSDVIWVDPRYGVDATTALALGHVERQGGAVLRGRHTPARRLLAAVAAKLPDGFEAIRVPEPSDTDVTTLLVFRTGEHPPGEWLGE